MASKVWVFFHTIWSTLHFFAFCYMFMLRCVPICCLWFLFSLNVQFCEWCTACVCYVHFTPSVNIQRFSFGISSLYVYLRATIWITRKLLFAQCCYLAKAPLQSQTVQSLPRSYYTYAFLFLSLLYVCIVVFDDVDSERIVYTLRFPYELDWATDQLTNSFVIDSASTSRWLCICTFTQS